MSDMTPFRYFMCGGVSGICYTFFSYPLDTAKVRLQAIPVGTKPEYDGMMDCIRKAVAREGVVGLYKGMGTTLFMVVPIFSMYFAGFGIGLRIFCDNDTEKERTQQQLFLAGCFSSLVSTITVAPAERIKCLLQVQKDAATTLYKGPVDCTVKLYKEGGLANIYKGTCSTVARDLPGMGVYFFTYESIINKMINSRERPPNGLETIVAGSVAGAFYWVIGMPADVVKTIYQTAPMGKYKHGTRGIFMQLLREEGVGALFKGLIPILLTAAPANGAAFIGFEMCRSFLTYWFPLTDK